MKPYFERDGITIYHGDCREVLPGLAAVDMVLTDPPYGLADKWAGGGGEFTKSSWRFDPAEAQSWDSGIADGVTALTDYAPVVIIWGGNYYHLPPARCWLLWDKKQNDQWTTAQAEMAWTNLDRPVRTYRMSQVEAHTEMGHKEHPTQKPVSLMRWCIKMARVESGTILDPFCGSGTTLRAAADMGFRAIGIEINEAYAEIAARRMDQMAMRLDEPATAADGGQP